VFVSVKFVTLLSSLPFSKYADHSLFFPGILVLYELLTNTLASGFVFLRDFFFSPCVPVFPDLGEVFSMIAVVFLNLPAFPSSVSPVPF